ncbi:MAG: hypothetical protein AB7T03_04350, partial [Bacilli bacterium]
MSEKIKKSLPLMVLCFSLLLFFSAFLSAIKTDDNEIIMTGTTAIFGGQVAAFGAFLSASVKFSFLNLLAFFLPAILSIALGIYCIFDKEESLPKKILNIAINFSFLLSIVFLAMLPANTKGAYMVFGNEIIFAYEGAKLAVGAILGLIFSSLGFVVS